MIKLSSFFIVLQTSNNCPENEGDDFARKNGYKSILTQYFFRKSLLYYKMFYIHSNIQGPSYSSKNSFRKYISTRSAFIVKSRGELKQEGKEMTKKGWRILLNR